MCSNIQELIDSEPYSLQFGASLVVGSGEVEYTFASAGASSDDLLPLVASSSKILAAGLVMKLRELELLDVDEQLST